MNEQNNNQLFFKIIQYIYYNIYLYRLNRYTNIYIWIK